jgi:hypothetical protein
MKILSRRTHGILDYVVGLVLILAPRLLGLEPGSAEANVPFYLGWAAVVYSLITRYELGVLKLLPFGAHLTLDVLSGVLLAASPWLFGFSDHVWGPHLILGLAELGAVAMTRTRVSEDVGVPGAAVHR